MLQEGWQDQYDRMRRAHQRFVGISSGKVASSGSADARDALFHFFQDAYHLKDWIKRDPALTGKGAEDAEAAVKASNALQLCADLCNGIKHLTLTAPRLGGEVVSQSVNIHVGGAERPGWAEHAWTVAWNGQQKDAAELASEVIAAWEAWLQGKHLL